VREAYVCSFSVRLQIGQQPQCAGPGTDHMLHRIGNRHRTAHGIVDDQHFFCIVFINRRRLHYQNVLKGSGLVEYFRDIHHFDFIFQSFDLDGILKHR